jgi:5-deoxy-5-amino-3-dehydroquinate synthase
MAKYAFLGVDGLADMALEDAVAACVECKAAVVSADEHESAEPGSPGRALLNYGHTLAHALETAGSYGLRHGEAVSIGLVFAARLARRLGRIDDDRVAEHEALVSGYGLPSQLPAGADQHELVAIMRRDKKASGHGLTFVLDGPAGLRVVCDVAEDAVLSTLEEGQG